jgi:hypothetical protein
MISPKPYISYKHIESKTPEALELMMLEISVKSVAPVNFSPPTYSDKKWHTWYLHDCSVDVRPKDKLDLESK